MATKLNEGSSIKREIRVSGVNYPVNVEITASGLEFGAKGSRKKVRISWHKIVSSGETGVEVPSFLAGYPVELLNYYGAKIEKL